jgi:hypothetical protein
MPKPKTEQWAEELAVKFFEERCGWARFFHEIKEDLYRLRWHNTNKERYIAALTKVFNSRFYL